jgi:para-aminobenzoate synthetase component 1
MKGTIDGNIPNAEELILSDTKELAEHATIVDLIRNDLSKVSKNVRVTKYRYYEQIKTQQGIIGQVSSEIEGILPENYNELIGDIIFDLLPAGSVSGAPKNKTKEIIAMAEQVERGYYTGVAGYFDGTNLDSCVLIRYLQSDKIYRSGGGITAQSKALVEYEEMINKVYVPAF